MGMGYGRNAVWLAEQGYEVEGWEVERRYVREAKREWREKVKWWREEERNSKLEARNSAERGKEGDAGGARMRRGRLQVRRPSTSSGSPLRFEGRRFQLRARCGDFGRMEWARGDRTYDVIVISQALHQLKRSEALEVLRRAKATLAPGGRLFLLAKLTRDRHVRRVAESEEWERVPGEKNTWRRAVRTSKREARNSGERQPEFHPGRVRRRWTLLSALTAGEIRRALRGLKLVHYREVVLRSDWEENAVVTHTVAEVVGERQ